VEEEDELTASYRIQVDSVVAAEANRRIEKEHDKLELARLRELSLLKLVRSQSDDLVPALMSRLGPVRAALDGHGGSLVVADVEETNRASGESALTFVIDLDGACVSCGAAPGTLKGIQDDLLHDDEIISVKFSSAMLDWFDDLQKEFILKYGEVTFVKV
tara:strand:+ start:66687 stop:67166 length:480 start_codon:yes stop_codon:yes gene_type:complete